MNTYYSILHHLIRTKRINIFLILAPPRSSSTLLEAVVSQHPNIHVTLHEPFVDVGYYGQPVDVGYENIIQVVKSHQEKAQKYPLNVLIKEMSHWLEINDEYQRFLPLVGKPPLLLIRNPLLTTESKIRVVLKVLGLRERPSVIQWLQRRFGSTNIKNVDGLEKQRTLLSLYAREKGFENWDQLLEYKFSHQDYADFSDLLSIEGLIPLHDFGWESLLQIKRYLKTQREYFILDATQFRLSPTKVLQQISQIWGLMSPEPWISGEYNITHLQIRNHKPHYRLWYTNVTSHNTIQPPTEPIPPLSAFPSFIQQYLQQTAIPAYVELFLDRNRIREEGQIAQLKELDPYISYLVDQEK